MPPVEPRDVPEADPYEPDPAEPTEAPLDPADLDALRARADVPGLLALAKAYRVGTAPGGRDMKMCFETYRAAAELGDAEAAFAVALFHLNGGPLVVQDLKEGAVHLRAAAERGSVAAKVYLGNLYELGIHYKADAEKADVWYRNAARTAKVLAEQGGAEWDRALAELGCVRHVLALTRDPSLEEVERMRLLARAKAHGYGLRIREGEPETGERKTLAHALASSEREAPAPLTASPAPSPSSPAEHREPRERKDTSPETKSAKHKLEEAASQALAARRSAERKLRVASALGAFGYALLFAVAGVGAGYAATLGARELVAQGHVLPLVGTHVRLVFPLVLALVGVLPAWLVYRLGTVLKALVMSAALAGVGWVAWGTGSGALHPDRQLQALAFGVAGFLAGLLVLGLLGGAKSPRAAGQGRKIR